MKELQAKIDQNKTDQQALKAEGERLEAKLKALEVLKHGDYGLCVHGDTRLCTNMHTWGSTGTRTQDNDPIKTKLGNVFVDLALKAKKLESFIATDVYGDDYVIRASLTGEIWVNKVGTTQRVAFKLSEAQEICDKLQCVINFAKDKTE